MADQGYRPHLAWQLQDAVAETTTALRAHNSVARIWAHDYAVWKPSPTEITNRLGWLTVAETMADRAGDLQDFANVVRAEGVRDIVLLGMGGSSLGPEVFRVTFGQAADYPRLHVLDSTVPAWVSEVTAAIDPAKTLFLVSSKSGGTIEVMSFFRHFYSLVERVRGAEAGQAFCAITDPGTGLEAMAREYGFRKTFSNPPDIGGRYSVLSYFGLVPAALMGMDVYTLLQRAHVMASACRATDGANPGADLGALVGTLARHGHDKLTFIVSPSVAGLGVWLEQLLAESTGKEGKGVIPIADEPPATVDAYGTDRLFAYIRLDDDENTLLDAHVAALEKAGHPVLHMALHDRYDLGAEFFRWEFATSVVGAVLGIHPFDQPNVQESKDNTRRVLDAFEESGSLPALQSTGALTDLLSLAQPGDYLAIMAYIVETPAVVGALEQFRLRILQKHHLVNTFGYGPRFLHSTGQLHKGGPNTGLFLQLTADVTTDVAIPAAPYGFAVLNAAQAIGDLESLRSHERRAIRIHLGDDILVGLNDLAEQALR